MGSEKDPRKFLMGVLESPGKVLNFLSVKEWEPWVRMSELKVIVE